MMNLIRWFVEADTQIFLWMNNNSPAFLDGFFLFITRVDVWIPLYALLLFVLYKKYPGKAFLWIIGGLVIMALLADQGSVRLFKETFQRLRPCNEPALDGLFRALKEGCGGKYGFVSSHAANTFALAFFVGITTNKKWWTFMVIWAFLVSYSRIHIGVHYPADIFFGALFGAIIGLSVGFAAKRPAQVSVPA
ncbi:MAG: phosphatase PAP2 family protein [Cryomorphaceae bacterium]|nr:phosphatase PAP2 family protein [Cryomorphaceae bacterium]